MKQGPGRVLLGTIVTILLGGMFYYLGNPEGSNGAVIETTQRIVDRTATGAETPSAAREPMPRVVGNEKKPKSISEKPLGGKSLEDFPCPVGVTPAKAAGNYYSETLRAYVFHPGGDYPQPEGAVIRVKHSGKVIYAGSDPILGNKVEIDGGENWSIVYGGLENLQVQEGERVEPGYAIGQVGFFSGIEGGLGEPHLHFEIWHGDDVQIIPGMAELWSKELP